MERRSGATGLTLAASVAVVVAALRLGEDLFIPLALAVLVSFMLTPLVARIERWLPRVVAVVAAVLLVMSLFGGMGWLVGRQLPEITAQLPEYRINLVAKIRSLRGPAAEMGKMADELGDLGDEIAQPGRGAGEPPAQQVEVVARKASPVEILRDYLAPLLGPAGTAGLVGVLAVFMLIGREDLRDRLIRLSGGGDLSLTTQAMNEVAERVSHYLLTTTLLNAAHGIVIGSGLWLIGLPTPFLFGLLSMLLRFIPYIGPWLAASLPIALSVAVFDGWTPALLTLGLFVSAELVSNNVLEPWLYGQSTGLSPFGVILAAVFWSWLWGVVGLLLAIPLTVCLVVLGRYVTRFEAFRIVLGDEPVLPPEARLYQRLLAGDTEEASELFEDAAASGAAEALDAMALPALAHLARDRARGAVETAAEARMRETLAEIVEEAREARREKQGPAPSQPGPGGLRAVCVPARDENDALAASWLAALLAEEGFEVHTPSTAELTSELVERVGEGDADAVCISALSPGATQHVRYLAKRLRARHPELEIVVGVWGQPEAVERARERTAPAEGVRWATTLAEAVAALAGAKERLALRRAARERGAT